MKRFFLAAAGIILVSSMVFAGGAQGGSSSSDPYYPIEITVFTGSGTQPTANNPMYKWLQEKLKVTFKWDILVGDLYQRRGVMVASGTYPDILQINETFFIEEGAVIPLEGLIEQYAPNLKKHYANVWEKMKSPDGHIYHLINVGVEHGADQSTYYNGNAFWIQKHVLKDAGYPQIKTVDQLFNLLETYYKKYPTINGQPTIPFTILTYDWRAFELWNPPNFLAGNPNEGNGIVNPVTYEYKNFFTMDISKRWFQLLNGYNARGLVDRTGFTDNYDQYLAKIAAGRVLCVFGQLWQFADADNANRDRGEYIRTMAPLPIVFDNTIKPHYRDRSIPNIGRGIGISKSAKDPVRIIRMLDQYITDEVQRTLQWGIEGQHWQRNAQGVPYRTQQQRANWENVNWREQNLAILLGNDFPVVGGSFADGYPCDLAQYYPEREAMERPEDKELWAAYGVTNNRELLDKDPPQNSLWYPTWNMPNAPDDSAASIALRRCEQTMKRMLPQIVLATPANFERLWTQYITEMTTTNNIAVWERYMQETLDARIKAWGGTVPRR